MRSLAVIVLLLALCAGSALSLRCYFRTEELHPAGQSTNASATAKQYDCPQSDKYCVNLGGVLHAAVQNLTFAFKSCESEVKSYIDPISQKLGQKLRHDCAQSDGKPRDVGPMTYWYSCCSSDLCNGALSAFSPAIALQLAASLLLLYTFGKVVN